MRIINIIHHILCGPILIGSLLGVGIFFTIYLKFPQIKFVPKSINLLLKNSKSTKGVGETSKFQAFATSLGGSIGVGCIAGTGMAISVGGPSSVLWMCVTAIIGMATKYVEVLLCHKYRKINEDGSISGTPMGILKNELKMPALGTLMAIATLVSAFNIGNISQANSIAKALNYVLGIKQYYTGIVMAIIIGFIILGGIKTIGSVAEKLIPFMTFLFIIIAFITIVSNYKNVFGALNLMFLSPFKANAALGGFLGTGFNMALLSGVNKGLFSNDAGSGASGVAHATSKEKDSFNEGVNSIIEPFLSTVVMCTLTGLVIVCSGVWNKKFKSKLDHGDITILEGIYSEDIYLDIQKLRSHITQPRMDFLEKLHPYMEKKNKTIKKIFSKVLEKMNKDDLVLFNGNLKIVNGKIIDEATILSNRSIAEDIYISMDKKAYTGIIDINNGKVVANKLTIEAKSRLFGVLASMKSFETSPLGKVGSWLLNVCLVLFSLTTILAWHYCGDRALAHLGGGRKSIIIYKILYLCIFFVGSLISASIAWQISEIFYALMTLPCLTAMIMMRKKVKEITNKNSSL